jgi:hypothetical protein
MAQLGSVGVQQQSAAETAARLAAILGTEPLLSIHFGPEPCPGTQQDEPAAEANPLHDDDSRIEEPRDMLTDAATDPHAAVAEGPGEPPREQVPAALGIASIAHEQLRVQPAARVAGSSLASLHAAMTFAQQHHAVATLEVVQLEGSPLRPNPHPPRSMRANEHEDGDTKHSEDGALVPHSHDAGQRQRRARDHEGSGAGRTDGGSANSGTDDDEDGNDASKLLSPLDTIVSAVWMDVKRARARAIGRVVTVRLPFKVFGVNDRARSTGTFSFDCYSLAHGRRVCPATTLGFGACASTRVSRK